MLHVQRFLKGYWDDTIFEETFSPSKEFHISTLEALKERYGIKYNIWEDKLVVLNYDQIESSSYKFHPIVRECRSLVLELGTWEIVSRSFDRFYNHGEDLDCEYEVEDLVAYEKVDGSLISVFYYKGEWLYRTKSMIMPDSVINENIDGVTWKYAIEYCIGEEQLQFFCRDSTWIFELVCKENRVVVDYGNKFPRLYFLACRKNSTGEFAVDNHNFIEQQFCKTFKFDCPKIYKFDTLDHCLQSAKELRNLEEGYVMYNKEGVPVMKVKNPAYVAAHHLRGNGPLTEKRVLDIILMNEQDEYLSIFPEDKESFEPYIYAYETNNKILDMIPELVEEWSDLTQKDFAMRVKNRAQSSIYFKVRQGKSVKEAWDDLTENSKRNIILSYVPTRRRR